MKVFAHTAAAIILFTAVLPIFAAAYAQDSAETILNLNDLATAGRELATSSRTARLARAAAPLPSTY